MRGKTTDKPASAPRREPVQQRSRERFDRMLAAASTLIAETGSDAMKMGEVAARAGVPIGSLYQFFPDKTAIIRTLAERGHAESRRCIEDGLANVRTITDLRRAFGALVDDYYAIFLAEPVMRDVWAATQTEKSLAELELSESKKNGRILAAALLRCRPEADGENIISRSFLIMHLGEATMRMAIALDRMEGDRIVEAYKGMADREIATMGIAAPPKLSPSR